MPDVEVEHGQRAQVAAPMPVRGPVEALVVWQVVVGHVERRERSQEIAGEANDLREWGSVIGHGVRQHRFERPVEPVQFPNSCWNIGP